MVLLPRVVLAVSLSMIVVVDVSSAERERAVNSLVVVVVVVVVAIAVAAGAADVSVPTVKSPHKKLLVKLLASHKFQQNLHRSCQRPMARAHNGKEL